MRVRRDEVMNSLEILSEAIDELDEVKSTIAILRNRIREVERLYDCLLIENADLRRELKAALERS